MTKAILAGITVMVIAAATIPAGAAVAASMIASVVVLGVAK